MDVGYTLSGLVVGTIVGLTGVGGGSLMTPLLILLFGVAPATAIGTDLLYAALTKSAGAVAHARRGNVDWSVVGRLAAGSVAGALAALAALEIVPADRADVSRLLTASLGVALVLTAIALVAKEPLQRRALASAARWRGRWLGAATVAAGLALGVLVTLSSVGAGALGVTALLFLYPRLSTATLVGTDIAHAVPLTLVAGLGHARMGSVDWLLLASLAAGSLPGVWLGTTLSSRLPERALRTGLALLLGVIGTRLVL